MRVGLIVTAGVFAGALQFWALAQAQEERSPQQIAQASNALALSLGDALERRCRVDTALNDAGPYLQIIADETLNSDIQVIASALQLAAQDVSLCAPAREALSSALQSSQVAQAAEATGAIASGPTAPFSAGGAGPPGGGGGSGYII